MAGFSVPQWLTNWVDARIAAGVKAALADVGTDSKADLDQLFSDLAAQIATVPTAVNTLTGPLITEAKADILGGVTAVPADVNTVLTQGALSVEQLGTIMAQAFNPTQIGQAVAQAIKQMTGGLLEQRPAEPYHGKANRED